MSTGARARQRGPNTHRPDTIRCPNNLNALRRIQENSSTAKILLMQSLLSKRKLCFRPFFETDTNNLSMKLYTEGLSIGENCGLLFWGTWLLFLLLVYERTQPVLQTCRAGCITSIRVKISINKGRSLTTLSATDASLTVKFNNRRTFISGHFFIIILPKKKKIVINSEQKKKWKKCETSRNNVRVFPRDLGRFKSESTLLISSRGTNNTLLLSQLHRITDGDKYMIIFLLVIPNNN